MLVPDVAGIVSADADAGRIGGGSGRGHELSFIVVVYAHENTGECPGTSMYGQRPAGRLCVMESALSGFSADWLTALQQHSWLLLSALFVVALAESLLVVGLLIPGVAILVALTLLAAGQSLSPLAWWLAGALGALCGDGISFHIGRRAGPGLARWQIFSRHPHWLPAGHSFFARYGLWSIALGRFIGPLRPLVPAVAGVCDMKPPTFWWINIWSSAAWAAFYLLPVYWFGQAVLTLLQPWQLMLGLGLATLVALLVSRLLQHRQRQSGPRN